MERNITFIQPTKLFIMQKKENIYKVHLAVTDTICFHFR